MKILFLRGKKLDGLTKFRFNRHKYPSASLTGAKVGNIANVFLAIIVILWFY